MMRSAKRPRLAASTLFLCGLAAGLAVAWQPSAFPALLTNALLGGQKPDFVLLPTNQLLRPWGTSTALRGRPVDIAYEPKRNLLAILNTRQVHLVDATSGARLADLATGPTSYNGIAFQPGTGHLWVSQASFDGLHHYAIYDVSAADAIEPAGRVYFSNGDVPSGIAFTRDGSRAFAALSRNNTVAVIDAANHILQQEIAVGQAPFGVAVCDRTQRVFVTNRGGRTPRTADATAPSSGSLIATDRVSGSAISGTVSVLDMKTLAVVKEIETGLAPSGIALSPDQSLAAVANGHSDSVTLIDTATLAVREIRIPSYPESFVGSQPIAVAFDAKGQTLFVACGGNNAIAVVQKKNGAWSVAGAIPAGWFPSALAVDQSGFLQVVNLKGSGSTADQKGTFNSREFEGSLVRLPAPTDSQIAAGMREVRAAGSPVFTEAGGVSNLASLGIEHVVLIVKENRTYDQVFGDFGKGNGDPKLTMYGRDITPNHHALAERYVLLDNFYTSGAISFDGHHWLMQGFVSDYVERAFAASPRGYAWDMADALTVSPGGFFWQGSPKPLNVRVEGEFCLPAQWDPTKQTIVDRNESDDLPWTEYWNHYKAGTWTSSVGCQAGVPALRTLMNPRFPYSSMAIADQIRAEEFLRELKTWDQAQAMPNLVVMTLNSDHTMGTAPGFPTPRAMVADNDLALGRIVESLSKSRFWPKTLVLVVEDDAQDGVDHVDGHRTVALAVGPHVRRGALDSNHYNQTSMVRTMQEIFGIVPKTRALVSARAMNSVFTPDADTAPYSSLIPRIALDEMNPPLRALTGRRLWAARQSMRMDHEPDRAPADVLNRILWWDAKGWDRPYPTRGRPAD